MTPNEQDIHERAFAAGYYAGRVDGVTAFVQNCEILAALQELYDHTADYIRINKLGDVHHNHCMKRARNALALPYAATPGKDTAGS